MINRRGNGSFLLLQRMLLAGPEPDPVAERGA